MYKRQVSNNRRVTLFTQIRKQLDLQKGDTISLHIKGNAISIRRVSSNRSLDFKRIIEQDKRIKGMTKIEIQESFDYGNWDHLPNYIAGEEEI